MDMGKRLKGRTGEFRKVLRMKIYTLRIIEYIERYLTFMRLHC